MKYKMKQGTVRVLVLNTSGLYTQIYDEFYCSPEEVFQNIDFFQTQGFQCAITKNCFQQHTYQLN